MTFTEILDQVRELLQSKGRISYRALKLQFHLDDEYLEGLKDELIEAEHVATDENGKVLIWAEKGADSSTTHRARADALSVPDNNQPEPTVFAASQSPASESVGLTGERRQLTVMFCDLVGSTALSEKLDPEDLYQLIRTYQDACRQVLEHYEGYIAQYLGDGLLIYFGYPAAHEDDALRAVRSGLGIIEALGGLSLITPVQVRIGIHTGPVVVGEVGQGDKREQLALGETPNIAARVQGKAEPDTVVISADTYRLVQGFFACQDLGQQDLKGLSVPLRLYQVQGEGSAQTRFDVSVQKGLTPLVGREEEVELLQRRWARSKAGNGQVVLLSGEAGIGKSRLLQVLKQGIAPDEPWVIEARCSPFYQNSALFPVIDQLQRFFQFERDDTSQEKFTKLEQSLERVGLSSSEPLTLLANLLSIPAAEDYPSLQLSPQKQKEKTLEVLVAWVQHEAERRPVWLEVEDLHWADPSTLELLSLLIDQVTSSRALILLTSRPEFSPPWPMRGHLLPIMLTRLVSEQIEEMAQRVTGGKALPSEVLRQLALKTDGVPLFVEELTKTVLELDLLQDQGDHYELTGPLPQIAIPSTPQDSLMARLDRMNTAREVAQLGAVIGREFSYALLEVIADTSEAVLQEGLRQLVEAELVYQRGRPPESQYTFKHALIQDAAYQSLLKRKRQPIHRQIAQSLDAQPAELTKEQPELIAHHYTEAGLIEHAIPYWQKAAQQAAQRSSNLEAASHCMTALHLLADLPASAEHSQSELFLQIALGQALIMTKGWGAEEVKQAYSRALELCKQTGETPQLFPVLCGLVSYYGVRAEVHTAHELSEQLLRIAQRIQDPVSLVIAHWERAWTHFQLGDFRSAYQHAEQGYQLYRSEDSQAQISLCGFDAGMYCLAWTAWLKALLGYPDEALQRVNAAIAGVQKLTHAFSLVWSLLVAVWIHHIRGEVQEVQSRISEVLFLAKENDFVDEFAIGTIWQGWTLAKLGQTEAGAAQIHQGIGTHRSLGGELARPFFLALLAEARGQAGKIQDSIAVLNEALECVEKTGERIYEAELYKQKGDLVLRDSGSGRASSVEESEQYFQQALQVAQGQSAKLFELRAATSLARLWQQQGKPIEAHQLLSGIYHWFTEGFDTLDLKDAKVLLAELASEQD